MGSLNIGEIPEIIAVYDPHHNATINACQMLLILKKTVLIREKEILGDGKFRVVAHP